MTQIGKFLDLYFGDARSKLIDLAAFLRSSRTQQRRRRFSRSFFRAALLHLAKGENKKAKAVLLTLSDQQPSPPPLPPPKVRPAHGPIFLLDAIHRTARAHGQPRDQMITPRWSSPDAGRFVNRPSGRGLIADRSKDFTIIFRQLTEHEPKRAREIRAAAFHLALHQSKGIRRHETGGRSHRASSRNFSIAQRSRHRRDRPEQEQPQRDRAFLRSTSTSPPATNR